LFRFRYECLEKILMFRYLCNIPSQPHGRCTLPFAPAARPNLITGSRRKQSRLSMPVIDYKQSAAATNFSPIHLNCRGTSRMTCHGPSPGYFFHSTQLWPRSDPPCCGVINRSTYGPRHRRDAELVPYSDPAFNRGLLGRIVQGSPPSRTCRPTEPPRCDRSQVTSGGNSRSRRRTVSGSSVQLDTARQIGSHRAYTVMAHWTIQRPQRG